MSFELFLTYQKMVTFWTYAGESGTTLKLRRVYFTNDSVKNILFMIEYHPNIKCH